jgi:hypothetical protein
VSATSSSQLPVFTHYGGQATATSTTASGTVKYASPRAITYTSANLDTPWFR